MNGVGFVDARRRGGPLEGLPPPAAALLQEGPEGLHGWEPHWGRGDGVENGIELSGLRGVFFFVGVFLRIKDKFKQLDG